MVNFPCRILNPFLLDYGSETINTYFLPFMPQMLFQPIREDVKNIRVGGGGGYIFFRGRGCIPLFTYFGEIVYETQPITDTGVTRLK